MSEVARLFNERPSHAISLALRLVSWISHTMIQEASLLQTACAELAVVMYPE